MSNPNPLDDLEALEGLDLDGETMTPEQEAAALAELQETARERVWLAGELPPAEDVAYTLKRMDAAAGEGLEILERIASAGERIAAALEKLGDRAATIADSFELPG